MTTKLIAGLFSDTHIGNFKRHDVNGSRLNYTISGFEQIIEDCYALGIRTFFFAGDITDTPKVLEINVIIELTRMAVRIKDKYPDIVIYAIDGNHDHYVKNLSSKRTPHTLEILQAIMPDQLVIVSDTYEEVTKDVFVHGIPYYENDYNQMLDATVGRVKNLVREQPDSRHYLLVHQTPKMLDNDIIPHDTDPNDERYSYFDHVYCGHIHTAMQLADNFLVLGNNIHRDAADQGKKKGYWLTNIMKPEKGNKFVYLSGYPEYLTVDADTEQEEGNHYLIEAAPVELTDSGQPVESSKFTTSVEDTEIVKNYWEVVDGKDEKLLTAGLSCIQLLSDEN